MAKGADPNKKNAAGSHMLSVAAARGYTSVLKALLDAGANPNVRNVQDQGNTPLLLARDFEAVRLLLARGANPRAADAKGETALHMAAYAGSLKIVTMLVARHAAIDARDAYGRTPLMNAVGPASSASLKDRIAVVKLLIAKGANVNARLDKSRLEYAWAGFVGDTAGNETARKVAD